MILGTHNSLTYAEPTTRLGRLLNTTSQCQELSIQEQYDYGVRYFDIRINRKSTNAKHGLVAYQVSVPQVLCLLNKLSTKEDPIYVSLSYENSLFERKSKYEKWFKEAYSALVSSYRNIVFTGGYAKHPWRKVIDVPAVEMNEKYWEFGNYRWEATTKDKIKKFFINLFHFSPKYWAEKNNMTYKKEYENSNLMLDFVNL